MWRKEEIVQRKIKFFLTRSEQYSVFSQFSLGRGSHDTGREMRVPKFDTQTIVSYDYGNWVKKTLKTNNV